MGEIIKYLWGQVTELIARPVSAVQELSRSFRSLFPALLALASLSLWFDSISIFARVISVVLLIVSATMVFSNEKLASTPTKLWALGAFVIGLAIQGLFEVPVVHLALFAYVLTRQNSKNLSSLGMVSLITLALVGLRGTMIFQQLDVSFWKQLGIVTSLLFGDRFVNKVPTDGVFLAVIMSALWIALQLLRGNIRNATIQLSAICVVWLLVQNEPAAALTILSLGLQYGEERQSEGGSRSRIPHLVGRATLAAALCLLVIAAGQTKTTIPIRKIGLVGNDEMAVFQITDIGTQQSPSFTNFSKRLSDTGKAVLQFDSVEASLNEELDLLIVINPVAEITDPVQTRLKEYVRAGGRIAVFSDHTDIQGVLKPTNALVSWTGMHLNYDSIMPTNSRWRWFDSARFTSIVPTPRRFKLNAMNFGVGASMKLPADALCVMEGIRSFSDIGNPEMGISQLGDSTRTVDELQGGNAVVGFVSRGKGSVMLFGDTSPFQDGSTLETMQFWTSVLEMDFSSEQLAARRIAALVGLILLSVSCLFYFAVWEFGVALAAVAWILFGYQVIEFREHPGKTDTKSLIVTTTPLLKDRDSAKGLDSAVNIGILKGLPIYGVGEVLPGANDIILLLPPSERIELRMTTQTLNAVEQGANLIIVCGHEQSWSLSPLLKQLGIRTLANRLGYGHVSNWEIAERASAPRLEFVESWELMCSSDWEPVVSAFDRTAVARRKLGKGLVHFIADSRFLESKNLSHEQAVKPGNVEFVNWLMDQ